MSNINKSKHLKDKTMLLYNSILKNKNLKAQFLKMALLAFSVINNFKAW